MNRESKAILIAGLSGAIFISLINTLPIPSTPAVAFGIILIWALLWKERIEEQYATATSLTYVLTGGFLVLTDHVTYTLFGSFEGLFSEHFHQIEIQAIFVIGLVGLIYARIAPALVGSLTTFKVAWEFYRMGRLRSSAPIGIPVAVIASIAIALLPSFFVTDILLIFTSIATMGFLLSTAFFLDSQIAGHCRAGFGFLQGLLGTPNRDVPSQADSFESWSDEEFLDYVIFVLEPFYQTLEYIGDHSTNGIVLCGRHQNGEELFLIRRGKTLPSSPDSVKTEVYGAVPDVVNLIGETPVEIYFITDFPINEEIAQALEEQEIRVIDSIGIAQLEETVDSFP